MDKGIPLRKEIAMGSKSAIREASGTVPNRKQVIDKKNMREGGICTSVPKSNLKKGGKAKKK